jgi:hypothetical protein
MTLPEASNTDKQREMARRLPSPFLLRAIKAQEGRAFSGYHAATGAGFRRNV